MRGGNRIDSRLVLGGIALGLLAVHLLTLRPGAAWHGDIAQLLLHARNLAEGAPYADTGYIQNPEEYGSPVAYAPGLPLLWAPFVALFGFSPLLLKVSGSVFLVGAVAALARLYFRDLPLPYLAGFALAAGLQPYLWEAKHHGFSGFALLAFVAASLWLYDRAERGEHSAYGWSVAAGVLAGYAGVIRPLGFVLIPCFLLPDLLRRQRPRKRALLAAGAALATVAVVALLIDTGAGARIAPSESGYSGGYGALLAHDALRSIGQMPERVIGRALDYGRAVWVLWYVPLAGGKVVEVALTLVALVPVGIGVAHRLRDRVRPPELFCLLYAASLLPWTFSQQRYLIPLVPFYYAYLFLGLYGLRTGVERWGRLALPLAAVALAVGYTLRFATADHGPLDSNTALAATEAYRYIGEHTPPSAVFLVRSDPRALPFFAQRAASAPTEDASTWLDYSARIGATYAFLEADDPRPRAAPLREHFTRVYANDTWAVYRIER